MVQHSAVTQGIYTYMCRKILKKNYNMNIFLRIRVKCVHRACKEKNLNVLAVEKVIFQNFF